MKGSLQWLCEFTEPEDIDSDHFSEISEKYDKIRKRDFENIHLDEYEVILNSILLFERKNTNTDYEFLKTVSKRFRIDAKGTHLESLSLYYIHFIRFFEQLHTNKLSEESVEGIVESHNQIPKERGKYQDIISRYLILLGIHPLRTGERWKHLDHSVTRAVNAPSSTAIRMTSIIRCIEFEMKQPVPSPSNRPVRDLIFLARENPLHTFYSVYIDLLELEFQINNSSNKQQNKHLWVEKLETLKENATTGKSQNLISKLLRNL
mgnify:CR=1 FL=1